MFKLQTYSWGKMDLILNGATAVVDGYGEITHQLSRALSRNHNVSVTPNKAWHSLDYMRDDVKSLLNKSAGNADFELFIFYPNVGLSSRHKCGILSMWEGSKLPTPWIEGFNRFSDVFVPSKFVEEIFKESGVTSDIHLLPLGVNTDLYTTIERKLPTDRPFRFLTLGKMEPRKNVETLVSTFLSEFPKHDDVELWIKTRERFCPQGVRNAANNDKRIKIIDSTVTEEELVNIYHSCDCFVYPSRGEGFAFPPRNAIATGMPTMVTDWSALAEIEGAVKIPVMSMSPMHPCGFSFGEESDILMADVNPRSVGIIMRDITSSSST